METRPCMSGGAGLNSATLQSSRLHQDACNLSVHDSSSRRFLTPCQWADPTHFNEHVPSEHKSSCPKPDASPSEHKSPCPKPDAYLSNLPSQTLIPVGLLVFRNASPHAPKQL